MASNKRIRTVQELVEIHLDTVRDSLDKLGLESRLIVRFPFKNKPPLLGRFGAWLVNRCGGIIDTRFVKVDGTITSKRSNKKRRN